MSEFTAYFPPQANDATQIGTVPSIFTIEPTWYSWSDEGGPVRANFTISGSGNGLLDPEAMWLPFMWLGRFIAIRNPNGTDVWWGKLAEVTATWESYQMSASLEKMTNRLRVIYSVVDANGGSSGQKTDWVENADSIARYGVREQEISIGQSSDDLAAQRAAELLARYGVPTGERDLARSNSASITMVGVGLFSTLDWQLYSNAKGLWESTPTITAYHALGWNASSAGISFSNHPSAIHMGPPDTSATFAGLPVGQQLLIVGSSENNLKRFVVTGNLDETEFVYYESTALYTEPDAEVYDPANGLDIFSEGRVIWLDGFQGAGDGYRLSESVSPDVIDFETDFNYGGGLGYYASDPEGHLTQHVRVDVSPAPTFDSIFAATEIRGLGVYVGTAIYLDGTWDVVWLSLPVWKYGDPTDNLVIRIYANNSGVPTGSALATITVDPDDVPTRAEAWLRVRLSADFSPPAAGDYWVVVSRGGSPSTDDFYVIGISEEIDDVHAPSIFWNGSSWEQRHTAASLPVRAEGGLDTTNLLSDIVTQAGQFLGGTVTLDGDSGVVVNQYRTGETTGRDEAQALLRAGVAGGKRLLAEVSLTQDLVLYEEPTASSTADPVWLGAAGLAGPGGGMWDVGLLPVGRYVRIGDAPQSVDQLVGFNQIYVGEGEYDVRRGEYRLSPPAIKGDSL